MAKNITIGQYIPGESFVHKLDPRTKILLAIALIVALFFVNNFTGYLIVFLFIIAVVKISGLKLHYLYKGLKPIIMLVTFTAVLNLFITQGAGQPLFQFWILKVYKEGVRLAIFMTLRLVFLILGTSLLTLTTSPIELTDGIESLLKPFSAIGVPAHELAMMMSIALRFIPTLMDETEKIMKAQKARGADFDSGNIFRKAQSLVPLLVPLFISSFRRAEDLAMAMEARCYRGAFGRTRMKELKYRKRDAIAFIVFALFFALIIIAGLKKLNLP